MIISIIVNRFLKLFSNEQKKRHTASRFKVTRPVHINKSKADR
ncbi:hypothetical protein BACIT_0304 [Bacillus amyloliquefaciens]|nr:hypothetical protein U471_14150 [Bacillus amyloliquefaciens CC178]QEY88281.1 hypothetical protein BACIT_0304 [Bacillus amyloliquefaciens]